MCFEKKSSVQFENKVENKINCLENKEINIDIQKESHNIKK